MKEHDVVIVNADTCGNELVTHDFIGTIVHIYTKDMVCVEDQEGNCYDVDVGAITVKD